MTKISTTNPQSPTLESSRTNNPNTRQRRLVGRSLDFEALKKKLVSTIGKQEARTILPKGLESSCLAIPRSTN